MSTYLWVDLGAVCVPFLAGFHPRLRFHRQWFAAFPAFAGMMAVFVPWDAAFTATGVWGFSPEHLCGVHLFGLPLEEVLFFLCIPYACLFSYHCFTMLLPNIPWQARTRWISIALVGGLLVIGALFADRAYTATTSFAAAAWIIAATFVLRAPWLGRLYFTYTVMLLPFLIVNGILTGTGLDTPVVWYNDAENLGLRIGTIPIEDVFYGLLMFGLTVTFYETVRAKAGLRVP
ncbi:MAG TPA: lycopene cyclase domain-containing protein [Flavobacteriales bacterium]